MYIVIRHFTDSKAGKKRQARRRTKPGEMIVPRTGEEFERLVEEFVSSGMKSSEFCRTLRPRPDIISIALALGCLFPPTPLQSRELCVASCFPSFKYGTRNLTTVWLQF
jgi:hypothetical protein